MKKLLALTFLSLPIAFSQTCFAKDLGLTAEEYEERYNSFVSDFNNQVTSPLLKPIKVVVEEGAARNAFSACPSSFSCISGTIDKSTNKLIEVAINGAPKSGSQESIIAIMTNLIIGSSAAIPNMKNFNATKDFVVDLVNKKTNVVYHDDYQMKYSVFDSMGILLLSVTKK